RVRTASRCGPDRLPRRDTVRADGIVPEAPRRRRRTIGPTPPGLTVHNSPASPARTATASGKVTPRRLAVSPRPLRHAGPPGLQYGRSDPCLLPLASEVVKSYALVYRFKSNGG